MSLRDKPLSNASRNSWPFRTTPFAPTHVGDYLESQHDPNRFQDPFRSETFAAGGDCEGGFLDVSCAAKGRQCEAPIAGHDDGRRNYQWLPLSGHARAGRSKRPLAQSEPEV